MQRKSLLYLIGSLAVIAIAIAIAVVLTQPTAPPKGVTVGGPQVSSVTSSPEAPLPSATVTETPSITMPTETINTMDPSVCTPDKLDPRCWNTEPDSGGVPAVPGSSGEVFDVSPSPDSVHGYDVVVFNVSSLADVQFEARYVPSVSYDASGQPVDVHGGAVLQMVIHAPANATLSNGFDFQGSAANYAALREIKYAGSFEGQTTFAIGVDHRVRFAVTSGLGGSSGTDKVILYLAHE